jgi:ABC-type nitrate/sulfonate/bicarbonate transport system substrate-binding protein
VSRRQLLAKSAQVTLGVSSAGSLAALLAACGQGGSDGSSTGATSAASAGIAIPKAHVDFAMSPFADDSIPVIGMKLGYFKDNGITIGPKAQGARLNLTDNIAPLVSGQVDAGSLVMEALIAKLDNVKNVRTFVVHGSFEGFALFVPEGSDAKSVDEIVKSGVPFDTAVAQAVAQFKGKKLALSTDASIQLFYQLLFSIAGLKETDFDVTRISNPNIVSLVLAGRTDLAGPSGGPQVVALAEAGLKEILNEQQILAASRDARRLGLINHSTFATTSDFYAGNYETVLRMAAAIFRTLDLVRNDPAAAAAQQLPYLNSYAGSNVNAKQLKFLHATITHERTFDEMDTFFTKPGSFNVFTSGASQIRALRKQKVLRQPHEVAEIDGAKKVWEDLVDYKAKADALFTSKSGADKTVLALARKRYEGRNYLDAYRALATL